MIVQQKTPACITYKRNFFAGIFSFNKLNQSLYETNAQTHFVQCTSNVEMIVVWLQK